MSKKRNFSFLIIGILVFVFYFTVIEIAFNKIISILKKDYNYNLLEDFEKKSQDLFIAFKAKITDRSFQQRYSVREISKNVSKDIMIIGIDEKTLNDLGRWPFKRSVHAKLADYFTNSALRESVLFYDVFLLEPDPAEDKIFINSVKSNKKVLFDYIARNKSYSDLKEKEKMTERINFLSSKFGEIKNVSGTISNAVPYLGLTPPLTEYIDASNFVGCANLEEDSDKILRKFPLVFKYIEEKEMISSNMKLGDRFDRVILQGFDVAFNEKMNEYYLIRKETNIFNITNEPVSNRKPADEETLKKINDNKKNIENDFLKKLDGLKKKMEQENKKFFAEAKEYILKNNLSSELKKNFTFDVDGSNSEADFSRVIAKLSEYFKKANDEKNYLFFKNISDRSLKADSIGEEYIDENNKNRKISLYDFIYNETPVFNKIFVLKERFLPSIPLAILSRYYNIEIKDIEIVFGKHLILKNPKIFNTSKNIFEPLTTNGAVKEKIIIPIDKTGSILINYAGKPSSTSRDKSTTFDAYSYSDFVSGKQILVKNKIVMVGAFTSGIVDDSYQTPMGTMFGLEVIANTVNTIITNNYITRLNSNLYLLILLFAALSVSFLSGSRNIIVAFLNTFIFLFVYFILSVILFLNLGLITEGPKVIIISVLSLVSVVVYRVLTEEKQKKHIKSVFAKYVNPNIVEELVDSPPELGGVDRELTIFFSDIRGFTTLSEGLPPQELITHLNKYFNAMTQIIFEHNGTLDKYIGDAIMCFWGAPKPQPDHAELACRAALKQLAKLNELNSTWPDNLKLNIGIGINSGVMTVGNVGSEGSMNYTVIGDNVNLGSRVESLNKDYGTNIIVSEYTFEKVKDKFNFRELDVVKVKGKEKPVKIFELLSEK